MHLCIFLNLIGFTPGGAMTPKTGEGATPGRISVRDKLSINREDAFIDEQESEFAFRQQQVSRN